MSPYQLALPEVDAGELDPYNFPANTADEKLLEYWNVNGHLYSSRYTDGDITSISALIRSKARNQPDDIAYLYPAEDSMNRLCIVTFSQLENLVNKAAVWYSRVFSEEIATANAKKAQPTIAMVGVGITFDYLTTMLALLRLHIRVLLLSNKNSSASHQHLLGACDAIGGVVDDPNGAALGSPERFLQGPVALVTIDRLQQDCTAEVKSNPGTLGYQVDDEWTLPSVIIHSSGTTGMPKPIVHTNRSLCLIARHYRLYRDFYFHNFQICAPLFHIGGLSVAISGLPVGKTATFPPPNWPPAPSTILTGWQTAAAMGHPVDCVQMAPDLVEDMYTYISSTTQDFTPLSKLKALQSGGAPFAPALLAKLVSVNVNMKTVYGQTEIAGPLRTLPHGRENPHLARLRNLYQGTGWVVMEDLGAGDGSAECVVYKGYPLAAQLWEKPDAPNPYRTNDIFREDPPGSGFWVLIGRKDDVVVHSNGEKTMAGGVATLLAGSDAAILNAAVFGNGRPCTAAVIGPRWETLADIDDTRVEELVWKAVESCNKELPKHSRIDRSLLLILGRDEVLPVTPKGTVKRNAAWEAYGDRLEALFRKFLEGSQDMSATDAGLYSSFAALSDAEYLEACVLNVCEAKGLADLQHKSFYEIGLDSQRAVRLRAMLVRRFGNFPLMFIFENPTFPKLLNYLKQVKSKGEAMASDPGEQEKLEWIQESVKKHCRQIDTWKVNHEGCDSAQIDGHPGPHVIYLTGANGALGNALIEAFVRDPTVVKVYCAVRGSRDVHNKLVKSLEARGYGHEVSRSDKLCAIPYIMTDEKLGLQDEDFLKLQGEVTTVLHNAWRLDFNQPVVMFEPDCLKGTMNLLSFCMSGRRKTFAFTSSISTIMGPAMAGKQVSEIPAGSDPRSSVGIGYAQSKYIVERVTQYYSSTLNMPVRLLRVGQLCGHSVLGVWNETEMWPIMIATGLNDLNAMPLFTESRTINWLPVDVCAQVAASIITSSGGARYTVNNLIHSRPVPWSAFLDLLGEAAGQTFARLAMAEWTVSLEKLLEQGHTDAPGLKLLGYFQAMATAPDLAEPEIVTKSVADLEPLDAAAVGRWLERWRQSGFVKSEALEVDRKA